MSEFSDSYHLKTDNMQDGIKLLQKAGKRGFVFAESNGWVTLVAEGESFMPNESLISANTGILLHFINAEDHGWGFTIYNGNRQISGYECFWEEDLTIDDSELDIKVIGKIIECGDEKIKDIKDILYVQDIEEAAEKNVAESFAKLIGLKYHEWVSYNYVSNEPEVYKEQCGGLIQVQ